MVFDGITLVKKIVKGPRCTNRRVVCGPQPSHSQNCLFSTHLTLEAKQGLTWLELGWENSVWGWEGGWGPHIGASSKSSHLVRLEVLGPGLWKKTYKDILSCISVNPFTFNLPCWSPSSFLQPLRPPQSLSKISKNHHNLPDQEKVTSKYFHYRLLLRFLLPELGQPLWSAACITSCTPAHSFLDQGGHSGHTDTLVKAFSLGPESCYRWDGRGASIMHDRTFFLLLPVIPPFSVLTARTPYATGRHINHCDLFSHIFSYCPWWEVPPPTCCPCSYGRQQTCTASVPNPSFLLSSCLPSPFWSFRLPEMCHSLLTVSDWQCKLMSAQLSGERKSVQENSGGDDAC